MDLKQSPPQQLIPSTPLLVLPFEEVGPVPLFALSFSLPPSPFFLPSRKTKKGGKPEDTSWRGPYSLLLLTKTGGQHLSGGEAGVGEERGGQEIDLVGPLCASTRQYETFNRDERPDRPPLPSFLLLPPPPLPFPSLAFHPFHTSPLPPSLSLRFLSPLSPSSQTTTRRQGAVEPSLSLSLPPSLSPSFLLPWKRLRPRRSARDPRARNTKILQLHDLR